MRMLYRQRGVALFTAVFLLVAVGTLAVVVGLISGQQHLSSVQTLEQTRAYFAARGRLDREIADLLDGGTCPSLPDRNNDDLAGFTTELDACESTTVNEGGTDYQIHEIDVRAHRGQARAGSLVQRSVRVQVTSGP